MFNKICDQKLESICVETPIGDMTVTVCSNGVHKLSLTNPTKPNPNIKVQIKDKEFLSKNKAISDSIKWLTDYFQSGQQNGVSVPDLCSFVAQTEFSRKVWSTLMNGTKFGETISYSELALSVGNPKACRAVGTAMKNNPIILMIPCHRVLKKDGTSGHYSAGSGQSLKQWLNSFEKQFNQK